MAVSNGAFNGEKQTLSYDFNERTANDNLLDFGLSLYARILGISVPIIGADMEMRTNPDGDGLSFQFNGGTYEIILRFYWFGVKFITGYNSEFNRSEFVNTNPYCVNAGGFFETD